MDSFHAEVSQLVGASHTRLESGKDDDDLIAGSYAFRTGCQSSQIRKSHGKHFGASPETVS